MAMDGVWWGMVGTVWFGHRMLRVHTRPRHTCTNIVHVEVTY